MRLRACPSIRLAGQITGCEGYVESAAIGLLAGRFAAAERCLVEPRRPPLATAIGALLQHLTAGALSASFQPMNVNFGLFPPMAESGKRLRGADRKRAYGRRALDELAAWMAVDLSGQAAAATEAPKEVRPVAALGD